MTEATGTTVDQGVIPDAAWLCMAVGDDRQFAGNEGYADDPSTSYAWDDRVPNHAQLQAGHAILLWDRKGSLGVSVIETITKGPKSKILKRCPLCGRASIKMRQNLSPTYRCHECKGTFDLPKVETEQVTSYLTAHDAGWIDLSGRFEPEELRAMALSPKSQHAMRKMNVSALVQSLPEIFGGNQLGGLASTVQRLKGGHVKRTVRLRVGQEAFRRHLLRKYGPVCALTGKAPVEVLDAAHLYSYAEAGEHHADGGLLLRRDLHRLYDLGLIAIHPQRLQLDVSAALSEHKDYMALDDSTLQVSLTKSQIGWISDHWNQHRGTL